MRIVEEGHVYELQTLDHSEKDGEPQLLTFVNREPGHEHEGTQTQEVLRALIDRTMHCDNCLRWPNNDLIIYHLRMALVMHEARALERKVEKGIIDPEHIMTNADDGHFALMKNGFVARDGWNNAYSEDASQYSRKPKNDSPLVRKMPNFCKTS